jgi:Fungal specific transcription factor domain
MGKRGPKFRQHGRPWLAGSIGDHDHVALAVPSPDSDYVENHDDRRAPMTPNGADTEAIPHDVPQHTHLRGDSSMVSSITDHIAATSAFPRWHELSTALGACYPDHKASVGDIINYCLSLFFEHLYSLVPLVHEASLRDDLKLLISHSTLRPRPHSNDDDATENGHVSPRQLDSIFTLITAICAEVAFLVPNIFFPEGETVAKVFLDASRACLHTYLETDIENPNANSVIIRYFHSNCLHAAGKPTFSWHTFGEAVRLVQSMRLHDESLLERLPPIEAEMRRRIFWIVYLGDKSAAVLNNHPVSLHRYTFEGGITTKYPAGDRAPSLGPVASSGAATITHSPSPAEIKPDYEILEGFNANVHLWRFASDALLEMRILRDTSDSNSLLAIQASLLGIEARRHLYKLYVEFITFPDSLPKHLQAFSYGATEMSAAIEAAQTQKTTVQCVNIQATFTCLRMIMARTLTDLGIFGSDDEQEADLRITEIARDMLRVLSTAPFWALQVNGEPLVSLWI